MRIIYIYLYILTVAQICIRSINAFCTEFKARGPAQNNNNYDILLLK